MKKFVLILLLLLAVDFSMACSCAMSSQQELIGYADTIFRAQILEVQDSPSGIAALVEPSTVWKGTPRPRVHSSDDTASCGYPFSEGDEYIIFADTRDDGTLVTGICSGTRLASEFTAAELATLDNARTMEDIRIETPISGSDPFFGVADMTTSLIWIAIFLIIVAILWMLHHKEKRIREGRH